MNDDKRKYHVCASFDTETTNIGEGNETRAFCILYIVNDIRDIDLYNYAIDRDDDIRFYRYSCEFIDYIHELIEYGNSHFCIPIIMAYNLGFDLQTIIYDLNLEYDIEVNCQSSTNLYTLDLLNEYGDQILRFWDVFHLEMGGLSAMGKTCGVEKANGDWDYKLIRTSETPITDLEKYYASRDVQVIPAYLRYLLHANSWLKQEDFGFKVITKTSLVRQMAKRNIANLKVTKQNGKKLTLGMAFSLTCLQQLPYDFESYALRKCAFRGGLTFTAGATANRVVRHVASFDVVSMHHAFINGRKVPMDFKKRSIEMLNLCLDNVRNTTLEKVLENYDEPFTVMFHMCVAFKNIRLKKDSCFEKWQISILASSKFTHAVTDDSQLDDLRNEAQENYIRSNGFHDYAENASFAFGKLYEAEYCTLFLSEVEFWCVCQVYDFDECNAVFGETTIHSKIPPDYITLQSNIFFKTKSDVKAILKHYKEGMPYEYDIPETIPENIADSLSKGTCETTFLESYYTSTVKGMFNGIYGTQAQDIFKPHYMCEDGELFVDDETRTTVDNFDEKIPDNCFVFYNYGLRIVGGSRMHLIIAMMLVYEKFGDSVVIVGGDTDSMKISMKGGIINDDIISALEPLHNAVGFAIEKTQKRVRELFPKLTCGLDRIGVFEYEDCEGYDNYDYHMEAWNKARISLSYDNKVHLTCAGLSRPRGSYNVVDFTEDLLKKYSVYDVFPAVLGYNVFIPYNLSYGLEHYRPKKSSDMFEDYVTDYLGNTSYVNQRQAIAIYDSGRTIGDTRKRTNKDNVSYLECVQNIDVDTREKWLQLDCGFPEIVVDCERVF